MVFDLPDPKDWIRVDTEPNWCGKCFEEREAYVEGELQEEYNHTVGGYLTVLECPECGHRVVWDDTITTPNGERF